MIERFSIGATTTLLDVPNASLGLPPHPWLALTEEEAAIVEAWGAPVWVLCCECGACTRRREKRRSDGLVLAMLDPYAGEDFYTTMDHYDAVHTLRIVKEKG